MTMITPSYLGETIEYSSLHACRSTLEDPTQTRGQLQERYKSLDQELKQYWDEWDAMVAQDGSADERGSATSKMVDLLNRRTYIRNLVRDVNDVLGY